MKNYFVYPYLLFFLLSNTVFGQLKYFENKLHYYRYSKHLDSSIFYFEKALPIALKNKDSLSIFILHKNLGDAYEHHEQLNKTLSLYAICERYIPYKNLKLKSFLLNDSAYTYSLLHDYDMATKLTLQSLKIAESSGDKMEIAITSIAVADGFSNMNFNKQAENYYKKGVAIANQTKSNSLLEYSNRYFAVHLLKNKKPNLAFKNLLISTKFAGILNDSISLAFNYQQLSIYYWQKKQFKKCFKYGKKAEKIWEKRAENRDVAAVCAQLGKYYLALKQFQQAEFYLKKALQFISTDIYLSQDLYSDLALLYNQKNKPNLAFDYLLKAKTTIEKIKDNENKSKVARLQIQFETDKKEIEIQKNKLQFQKSLLREVQFSSRFSILVVILIFSLLCIILISFYLKKIKSKNQQLKDSNKILEKMSLQKKILLQEIHHRVKNNLTLLKGLFFLHSKSSENSDLKKLLKECELRIDSMALIHQSLYENSESDQVDLTQFIDNLFASLKSTFKSADCKIEIKANIQNIDIKLSKGIYLGLILNELATNSYKYAFQNQKEGFINLMINKAANKIEIIYQDSGIGIENFDQQKQGFGLKLIDIMMQQLNAKIDYTSKNGLSQFKFSIDDV